MIISLFFHRLDQLIPIQLCHFLNQGQVHMGVTMLGASLPGSTLAPIVRYLALNPNSMGFRILLAAWSKTARSATLEVQQLQRNIQ